MYHPSAPCGAQVLLASGFSLMIILQPGGESGVLLKSNVPSSAVYADIFVLRLDFLSKFNFNMHYSSR